MGVENLSINVQDSKDENDLSFPNISDMDKPEKNLMKKRKVVTMQIVWASCSWKFYLGYLWSHNKNWSTYFKVSI